MDTTRVEPRHRGSEGERGTHFAGASASNSAKQGSRRKLPLVAEWRNAVRDCRELSSQRKCVLFVLSTYMDQYGAAWPSQATLALGAGVGRRTAHDALKQAQVLGLLDKKRRGPKASLYRALVVSPDSQQDVSPQLHESVSESVPADSRETDNSVSPPDSLTATAKATKPVVSPQLQQHEGNGKPTAVLVKMAAPQDGEVYLMRDDEGRVFKWRWADGGNALAHAMAEAVRFGYPVRLTLRDGWVKAIEAVEA